MHKIKKIIQQILISIEQNVIKNNSNSQKILIIKNHKLQIIIPMKIIDETNIIIFLKFILQN